MIFYNCDQHRSRWRYQILDAKGGKQEAGFDNAIGKLDPVRGMYRRTRVKAMR